MGGLYQDKRTWKIRSDFNRTVLLFYKVKSRENIIIKEAECMLSNPKT